MLEGYENYKEFVKKVMTPMPVMRTDQLKLMISRYFNQNYDTVDEVIFAMKSSRIIIMTVDGWCMTIGEYLKLTGDYFLNTQNEVADDEFRRYPPIEGKLKNIDRNIIDSLWLVADSMPESFDFAVTMYPFSVAYCTKPTEKKPSLLYQITVIRKGQEFTKSEMLKTIPPIQSKHVRDVIRRICILEDESYAFRVPYKGFSHILVLDKNEPSHLKLVEQRKDSVERWKDETEQE